MTVQKTSAELYEEYKKKMQQIADVRNATAVLGWDQETYLPEKGAAFRGQQLTTLSSLAHELFSHESLGSLLRELQQRNDLTAIQKKNVTLSLEDYEKNRKYPAAFVAELSTATNSAYHAWIRARKEKNYAVFEPALEKMVAKSGR